MRQHRKRHSGIVTHVRTCKTDTEYDDIQKDTDTVSHIRSWQVRVSIFYLVVSWTEPPTITVRQKLAVVNNFA